jgi:hypothetical protein
MIPFEPVPNTGGIFMLRRNNRFVRAVLAG